MVTEEEARKEIELENKILKLTNEQLLQIEYETLGAFSVLFHGKGDILELQEIYFNWVVDIGWDAGPLNQFVQPESSPEQYNAAGSMSAAFDLLAVLKLRLSPDILAI